MENEKVVFKTFKEMGTLYKVLSEESRLHILWLLCHEEMCVSEIAKKIKMTTSATSHQLRELRLQKLVKIRRNDKRIYYSIRNSNIKKSS